MGSCGLSALRAEAPRCPGPHTSPASGTASHLPFRFPSGRVFCASHPSLFPSKSHSGAHSVGRGSSGWAGPSQGPGPAVRECPCGWPSGRIPGCGVCGLGGPGSRSSAPVWQPQLDLVFCVLCVSGLLVAECWPHLEAFIYIS